MKHMKTIHRPKMNVNYIPNKFHEVTFLHSADIIELIKRADTWCKDFGFDYDSRIYKVIEATDSQVLKTPDRNFKQSSKFQSRDLMKHQEVFYYEVRLRKLKVA